MSKKLSETRTENIFRAFYGATTFEEKSAISPSCGFTSKKGTDYAGYPDFFLEDDDFCIVVEAKASDHDAAKEEVQHYAIHNKIPKDIVGIAVSGQSADSLRVTYFLKQKETIEISVFPQTDILLPLPSIRKQYAKTKYGESVTTEALIAVLKYLNKRFNDKNKIRDTDRSLFFSGLMIALKTTTSGALTRTFRPHRRKKSLRPRPPFWKPTI